MEINQYLYNELKTIISLMYINTFSKQKVWRTWQTFQVFLYDPLRKGVHSEWRNPWPHWLKRSRRRSTNTSIILQEPIWGSAAGTAVVGGKNMQKLLVNSQFAFENGRVEIYRGFSYLLKMVSFHTCGNVYRRNLFVSWPLEQVMIGDDRWYAKVSPLPKGYT